MTSNVTYNLVEETEIFTVKFSYIFSGSSSDEVHFAYTYPYSFTQITGKLDELEENMSQRKQAYCCREVVTYSMEGRPLEMITVTSKDKMLDEHEPLIPGLFPEHCKDPSLRPRRFDKKTIFLSSRVHTGETGASYMLNGFIDLLMDFKNPQSRALLKYFVFKIVPAINPDGIYRGYYRLDTEGQNLNRSYLDPSPTIEPTIYAIKKILLQ